MPAGSCTLDEESCSVSGRKRVDRILVLSRKAKRNTARDDEPKAQGAYEQVREIRGGVDQVFERVDDEKELSFSQIVGKLVASAELVSGLRL